MKKITILILALFSGFILEAQIAISKNDAGKLHEFDKARFSIFKATTTVFVLSNIYEKEQYEKLLKETWTVTPYIVVSPNDFDFKNYLDGKFSFAHLRTKIMQGNSTFFMHSEIEFYMLDMEKINTKLAKVKNDDEKFVDLIFDNKLAIGRIALHSSTDMIALANKNNGSGGGFSMTYKNPEFSSFSKKTGNIKMSEYKKEMLALIYDTPSFKNFTLGHLKNYFTKTNELITKEQFCWLYEEGKTSEINQLKTVTLYLPDNLKTRFNPNKFKAEEWKSGELEKVLSKYKYKYEFISKEQLDEKILKGEEIYYLCHVTKNSEKFVHVVNAKTSEVIYRGYSAGFSEYNIKDDDFEDLTNAINKK